MARAPGFRLRDAFRDRLALIHTNHWAKSMAASRRWNRPVVFEKVRQILACPKFTSSLPNEVCRYTGRLGYGPTNWAG